jgi:hypothetical protein
MVPCKRQASISAVMKARPRRRRFMARGVINAKGPGL